jgi:acyl carrier protein
MNDQAFLEGLAEVLQVEQDAVQPVLELTDGNWDSLAILSAIALIDEHYGVTVAGEDLKACNTVGGIQQLIHSSVKS